MKGKSKELLYISMNSGKKWYAVYTKPRWEKKVHRLLLEQGLESYCPMNKLQRKWSDRIKTIEEPLFKSYVFVRIESDQQIMVRMTPGIINFVYYLGKPAIIRNKEIDTIKNLLDEFDHLEVEPVNVQVGQEVVIQKGIFMNIAGKVTEIKNKKLTVKLEGLGVNLIVTNEKVRGKTN